MKIRLGILLMVSLMFAQSEQPYPPLELVSIPTAGTLPKGSYTYETILTKNGGVTPKLAVGLTENLTFGFAYGIHNLIGYQKPEYNPQPGFIIKYLTFFFFKIFFSVDLSIIFPCPTIPNLCEPSITFKHPFFLFAPFSDTHVVNEGL